MTWTLFWDMHSGGGLKEKWSHIYIEAPEDEARVIFYNRFGHNPERVTCTCCGDDYAISTEPTLALVSGYHRNCDNLETPLDPATGRYAPPDDPWFREHYYIEPGEQAEAEKRGYKVQQCTALKVGRQYMTVEEYAARRDVLVIEAAQITDDDRRGGVPEQGYVWAG